MQKSKVWSGVVYYQACLGREYIKANSFLQYKHTYVHWNAEKSGKRILQKVKLPDVSAIVAATALWKHLIMLRNDASSLGAEVLPPLSSCVSYTLRSYPSCPRLLSPAAVRMLSHSSPTEFAGTGLSVGSRTGWRWRPIWSGREWIPNTKLSAPRVCYIIFWKSLFRESQWCLWAVKSGNTEGWGEAGRMWLENKILSRCRDRSHISKNF